MDIAAIHRRRETRPEQAPTAGIWDLPAPASAPSAWSSEPSRAAAPMANDVWGRLSEESEIDWSRGSFASVPPPGQAPRPVAAAAGSDTRAECDGCESAASQSAAAPDDAPESAPVPALPSLEDTRHDWDRFAAASGLPTDRLRRAPAEALVAAGAILRQMVGGLMLMIEARARAKAGLGVQATGLELDGNNPLKFVRSPERALLLLLDAPEPGFMSAERAIEDACQDLQAHQMATLSAMRGALEGTLARFSPTAIRARVGEPGRLARWFPILSRARQWDSYERDYEGVVRGSDEAFMDLFAKAFRMAYDQHIADMKARPRP
jgi:type VI secretion system protein ImpI/type VI secretion system protein